MSIGNSNFPVPDDWYGRFYPDFYPDSDRVRLFGQTAFDANPTYGMGIELWTPSRSGDAIESLHLIRPRRGGTTTTSLQFDEPLAWQSAMVGTSTESSVENRGVIVVVTREAPNVWSFDITGDGMDLTIELQVFADSGRLGGVHMNLSGSIAGDPVEGWIRLERTAGQ